MHPGIPVATVAINGAKNAAYLALQILGTKHECVREKLLAHRVKMHDDANKANETIMEKYR